METLLHQTSFLQHVEVVRNRPLAHFAQVSQPGIVHPKGGQHVRVRVHRCANERLQFLDVMLEDCGQCHQGSQANLVVQAGLSVVVIVNVLVKPVEYDRVVQQGTNGHFVGQGVNEGLDIRRCIPLQVVDFWATHGQSVVEKGWGKNLNRAGKRRSEQTPPS